MFSRLSTPILFFISFALLTHQALSQTVNGFSVTTTYSNSDCSQATSAIGDWLYDVNTATTCTQDPASNTYTKATCFVEGLGSNSTVHYSYETASDSACSASLTPSSGDSAICAKNATASVSLTCSPYYTRTVSASNFNGMGLVAGSASFQYGTCDTNNLYNFEFAPIDNCSNYVNPDNTAWVLNTCYQTAKYAKASSIYYCMNVADFLSALNLTIDGTIAPPATTPTTVPTSAPSTSAPTPAPSNPTSTPSNSPTTASTSSSTPSTAPTSAPSNAPTNTPPNTPTAVPTTTPTAVPTTTPTNVPSTSASTSTPTNAPTNAPTGSPSTSTPTNTPSSTSTPTNSPTSFPTSPSTGATPTNSPSSSPTSAPPSSPELPDQGPATSSASLLFVTPAFLAIVSFFLLC